MTDGGVVCLGCCWRLNCWIIFLRCNWMESARRLFKRELFKDLLLTCVQSALPQPIITRDFRRNDPLCSNSQHIRVIWHYGNCALSAFEPVHAGD